MKCYDLNHAISKKHYHVVRIILQQWEYQRKFDVKVYGISSGFNVLNAAISILWERFALNGCGKLKLFSLVDCESVFEVNLFESDDPESILRQMVVSSKIMKIKERKDEG